MVSPSDHLRQWKHNRSLILLIPPQYPDWVVTVTFYAALHAIDALLSYDKITVTKHEERNRVLRFTNRYAAINKAYVPLYQLCRVVRYLANPEKWIVGDQIESEVFRRLYQIEKSVSKLSSLAMEASILKA